MALIIAVTVTGHEITRPTAVAGPGPRADFRKRRLEIRSGSFYGPYFGPVPKEAIDTAAVYTQNTYVEATLDRDILTMALAYAEYSSGNGEFQCVFKVVLYWEELI